MGRWTPLPGTMDERVVTGERPRRLPAKVGTGGMRQLSISLGEAQARELERMRAESGLRSWNQVIRMLIADAMARRAVAESVAAEQSDSDRRER